MTFQEKARGFGQSVVQLGDSRVAVAAPQEAKDVNQTGGLYQCDYSTSRCEPISLKVPPEAVNMSLGLSLAASTDPSQLLACGPTVQQTCKENTYVKGMCFLFGSNLMRPPQKFPEAIRECPQQESDIAFLIDGSGSIHPTDFQKMKEFVYTVMEQFTKSKTLFSLMQYSDEFRTHFNFDAFKKNPNPRTHVNPIRQLNGKTKTASGIRKVVRELFQKTSGARENAVKILVVITDGEKYGDPLNYEDVIPEADRAGVIRYVIGNGPLLGSVGSFDWAGGAFLYTSQDKATFVNTTRVDSDMNDAYLGYSSAVIMRSRVQSLLLGAPRYQHTGLVVMFRQNFGAWEPQADIKGSQIGSYFGASLCSVDMDGDGNTNLILIGAPHYYEQTRGGQVSVCPLPRGRARWQCEAILHGEQGHPWGRFGAALTVLGDVNGDKLTDVAVGAPGEQENQGAVYIFHGASTVSISTAHSQCVGAPLAVLSSLLALPLLLLLIWTLRFLSGGASFLPLECFCRFWFLMTLWYPSRAQPVLRLEATMEFIPNILARSVFECQNQASRNKDAGEVRVCLRVRKSTRDRLQEGDIQSTVTYDLALDPGRTQARVRAIFEETKNTTRRRVQVFGLTRKCETLKLQLPVCVEDSVSPIILRLNYTLVGEPLGSSRDLRPVLAEDAQRLFTATVTFNVTFDVDSDASLGNKLLLKANVTSENNMSRTHKTEAQLELPVKYAVYMVVTSDENSTKYLNFTASEMTSQDIQHQYQFNNLGQRSLPISVVFWIPVQLNKVTIWDHPQVVFSQNLSNACHTEQKSPPHSKFQDELEKAPVLNCSVAVCKRIQCDLPSFNTQEMFNVTLKGKLSFDWYIKTSHKHLLLVSTAEIVFNDSVFALLPGQGMFVKSQTQTKVEPYEVHNPVPLIVGSSIGGLVLLALITAGLYKFGFFKRQYKDMMNEAAPQEAPPQ
ncbi:Integrin alpha-M [Microtus ochrogaster]|uniref:Integrin alpha-M n=1 Tax=Microtus ochrogaster TaxID=79684 RepID=A0A8J6GPN1_MICOH|nr:Integrin alpha-M [Microtus ochrogaster]